MVPQAPGHPGQFRVVGRDHPALAGGHVLHRVEAPGGQVRDGAHAPPPVLGAQRVRGVLDERDAAGPGQRAERVEVARLPRVVHRHHRPGARGDPALHLGRIQVERVGPHVREHRRAAPVEHRVGGGREGERRGDHLVAGPDAGREDGRVQRGGPGGDRDAARRAHAGRDRLLEPGDGRAGGHPAAGQARHHRGDVGLVDRVAPVRQHRGAHRPPAVEREGLSHPRGSASRRRRAPAGSCRSRSDSRPAAPCLPSRAGSPTRA